MIQMGVAVHHHKVPDSGLEQIVPHPFSLSDAGKGVVDQRVVAPVNDIGGHTDVVCAEIRVVTRFDCGLGRSANIETQQVIIDAKDSYVHVRGVGGYARNKHRQQDKCLESGPNLHIILH